MEKWMVTHSDNGQNGLKFQIIGVLGFPSIFYQACLGVRKVSDKTKQVPFS
jgi:hypothetical protein